MMIKFDLKINALLFILLLFFIFINTWIYICGEDLVYLWDYKGYWLTWQSYGDLLSQHFFRWLAQNEHEIRGSDYNPLPVSLLFPFYFIFGAGRFGYILGLTIIYLSLVCLLLALLMRKVFDNNQKIFIFTLIMSALFVPFWRPTLRGYPDIVGLLPILGAILLVTYQSISTRLSLKKSLWLGLLLWAPFLLRRWYAYTVVSLYITLPILVFFYDRFNTNQTDVDKASVFNRLRNIFIAFSYSAIATVVLAYGFQSNLIRRILSTDYSQIYSAYQASLSYSIWNTLHGTGYYILPLAVIGLAFSLFSPLRKSSMLCWFSLGNLLISFFLFTRTQSPGIQHQLPFAMWIMIIALIGMINLVCLLKKKGIVLAILLALLSFIIFFNNLYRAGPKLPAMLGTVLPEKNYSLRLANLNHYHDLVDVLASLTSTGEKFAVFSSDDILCDDLIDTLAQGRLQDKMVRISQVDLRDKLRLDAFMIKYLVVADPVQLHLGGSGQDVVKFPTLDLLNGQVIGKSYQKLPYDFLLANNVHAYIYEKTQSFTWEQANNFIEQFTTIYPEWCSEYQQGLALEYLTAKISLGDVWGSFNYLDSQSLAGHPGETKPTVVDFHWRPERLAVQSVNRSCPDADGVVVTLDDEAGMKQTVKIPNGGRYSFDIKGYKNHNLHMVLDKGLNSHCDEVNISK